MLVKNELKIIINTKIITRSVSLEQRNKKGSRTTSSRNTQRHRIRVGRAGLASLPVGSGATGPV